MLTLCLMLSVTYYAQNYTDIIGWSLHAARFMLNDYFRYLRVANSRDIQLKLNFEIPNI